MKSFMRTAWNLIVLIATFIKKSTIKGMIWLYKNYPEFYSIPAAFLLWALSSTVIWIFDPEAGAFDAGVFQIPVFSIVLLFIFLSVSWIAMKLVFGTASKFLKIQLKETFNLITPWQKILYSTGIFFLLFYALVQLSHILLLTRPGGI